MTDSTVAALTAASALDGTELFYGVQGGADRKITGSQVKTLVGTPGGAPSGAAGGDLSGSYPNPTVAKVNGVTPIQSNFVATTSPAVGNDGTQGYAVGSPWQNANTGQVWICRSSATGAAVWTLLGLADHPGYIAGNWYLQTGVFTGATGTNPGIGSIRLYAAYIKERCTLSNLGIRISAGATGNLQAAIYKNNPATGRPTGTALVSTASMSTAGSASNVAAAASVQLEPGLYWWATNTDNATSTIISLIATSLMGSQLIGSATQANVLGGASGNFIGLSTPATFGTWGDLTAATFTEVAAALTIPLVQFQIASVP